MEKLLKNENEKEYAARVLRSAKIVQERRSPTGVWTMAELPRINDGQEGCAGNFTKCSVMKIWGPLSTLWKTLIG